MGRPIFSSAPSFAIICRSGSKRCHRVVLGFHVTEGLRMLVVFHFTAGYSFWNRFLFLFYNLSASSNLNMAAARGPLRPAITLGGLGAADRGAGAAGAVLPVGPGCFRWLRDGQRSAAARFNR